MGRQLKKKDPAKRKKKTPGEAAEIKTGNSPAENTQLQEAPKAALKEQKKPVPKEKRPQAVKASGTKQDPNFIEKTVQFLREVKAELKKVTWPSRKQTIGSTAVVIVFVVIISFFLGAVDIILSSILRVLL